MASVELNKDNMKETIEKSEILLVDFWAPWCGPCRAFGPVFERVSEEFPNVVFGKVNTEDEPELAQAFEVRSIPTLAIFKDKDMVFYQPGMLPEEALKDLVEKVKALDMNEVRKESNKETAN